MGSWVRVERGSSPPPPMTPWAFQDPVLNVLVWSGDCDLTKRTWQRGQREVSVPLPWDNPHPL